MSTEPESMAPCAMTPWALIMQAWLPSSARITKPAQRFQMLALALSQLLLVLLPGNSKPIHHMKSARRA